MPNLADKPMQHARAQLEDAWNMPDEDFHAMAAIWRKGTIVGRVTGDCWQAAGRIYYQVRGPVSPETDTSENGPNEFVFCKTEYRDGQSHNTERFTFAGATKLWKYHGRAIARGIVATGRYRIERESNYVTLTFWTPQREPVETIYFCYRKDGQEGYMKLRPRWWPLSKQEPTNVLGQQ